MVRDTVQQAPGTGGSESFRVLANATTRWLELYNSGSEPVALNTVILGVVGSQDSYAYLLPTLHVIAPYGYAVVGNNANRTRKFFLLMAMEGMNCKLRMLRMGLRWTIFIGALMRLWMAIWH
jgi:hypothetical protein